MDLPRNPTRAVRIGSITIGQEHPIAVQSMTATHTTNIDATVQQVNAIAAAGADVIRIAVDSKQDAAALAEIRKQTTANLSVDLQENYRLAELVAPHVDKVRYNPGHLYHHEREKPWQDKVRYLADVARDNDCAIRVGVNCGSVDPDKKEKFDPSDSIAPDARKRVGALRFLGLPRLHAVRRLAERQRSAEGHRRQPPLRRAPVPTCRCTSVSPKPGCLPTASSKRGSPSSNSSAKGSATRSASR